MRLASCPRDWKRAALDSCCPAGIEEILLHQVVFIPGQPRLLPKVRCSTHFCHPLCPTLGRAGALLCCTHSTKAAAPSSLINKPTCHALHSLGWCFCGAQQVIPRRVSRGGCSLPAQDPLLCGGWVPSEHGNCMRSELPSADPSPDPSIPFASVYQKHCLSLLTSKYSLNGGAAFIYS